MSDSFRTIGLILAAMVVVAFIELAIPLRARNSWNKRHLAPNLMLTFMTFATNIVFNLGVLAGLTWLQARNIGLLNVVHVAPLWSILIVVLALDFAFYAAHVSMHKVPAFWRFHSVHHSDPVVDVTTTIRQHPVEGVIRYGFIALFAFPLGAGPAAFAVYRIWSALNGLFEHANIRIPAWLDRLLSWVTTWPNMHKVHHSRDRRLTDSNYGNIFSLWDRLFFTFTPSKQGGNVTYGLNGCDDPEQQTTVGLLVAPFRGTLSPPRASAAEQAGAQ